MTHLAYRTSIRALLGDIATLSEVEGPIELINMWFDDLYLPGQRAADYRKDVWDRGQREFSECFTASELAALNRFHQVFVANLPHLSEEWPGWRQDPRWLEVRDAAAAAVEIFDAAA